MLSSQPGPPEELDGSGRGIIQKLQNLLHHLGLRLDLRRGKTGVEVMNWYGIDDFTEETGLRGKVYCCMVSGKRELGLGICWLMGICNCHVGNFSRFASEYLGV